MEPSKDAKVREAVSLVKKAMKLFDEVGHDLAAVHCQEALEVVEYGHVLRPEIERLPRTN